jgi:hypothetical protein
VSLPSWALVLVSQLFDVSAGLVVSRSLAALSVSPIADVSSVLGVAFSFKQKLMGAYLSRWGNLWDRTSDLLICNAVR